MNAKTVADGMELKFERACIAGQRFASGNILIDSDAQSETVSSSCCCDDDPDVLGSEFPSN
jgi:hypothetical protein